MSATLRRLGRLLALAGLAAALLGCAGTLTNLPPEEPARHTVAEFEDDERMLYVPDPWVGFNKNVYKFNYYLDKYLLLPVVSGYELVLPQFAQDGVSNFFNNVGEVKTLYNSLLQAKGQKSLRVLGRFLVNSTIGVAGFFDVATRMGMERELEDFGQTLGVWGVGTGPYVVVPFLGPKTARAASGWVVDSIVRSAWVGALDPYGNMEHGSAVSMGVTAVETVDTRHQESFRYHGTFYPFEYLFVRYLYYQQREFAKYK